MALSQSPLFELRTWTIQWFVAIVLAPFRERKNIRLVKNLVNVLSVIRPVSRDMQSAICIEATIDQFKKLRLDHTTLVVAFLGPRIGEVNIDALQ